MQLLDVINNLNPIYVDGIASFNIKGFNFFYCVLKQKNEAFGVCLNKSLVHKNDLKVINKKFRHIAKIYSDNAALKSDVLYIVLKDYQNILENLEEIANFLHYINYRQRESCIMCGCKTTLRGYNKKVIPIDEKCIKRLQDEKNDFNNSNKLFKKAFLFSLIGSFVGIVPSLIIALLVRNYTLASTLLLFISPFCSLVLFNNVKIIRTTKNDIICGIISLLSILLYHLLLVMICCKEESITSIDSYFKTFDYLIIESMIETVFVYVVGFTSATFLIKKKAFIRFNKL